MPNLRLACALAFVFLAACSSETTGPARPLVEHEPDVDAGAEADQADASWETAPATLADLAELKIFHWLSSDQPSPGKNTLVVIIHSNPVIFDEKHGHHCARLTGPVVVTFDGTPLELDNAGAGWSPFGCGHPAASGVIPSSRRGILHIEDPSLQLDLDIDPTVPQF